MRDSLIEMDFFELAQSGGSEQNSVSIALKPLYEEAFFKPCSGADREKFNQIKGLISGIEALKKVCLAEQEGFEPSIRETRIPDFESGAFDHSAIAPQG